MAIIHQQLAKWIKLPQFDESRGRLTALDFDQLPFVPSRIFYITEVSSGTVRGEHAHKDGAQILICLSGRIEVELRSDLEQQSVICEPHGMGLILKQGVWAQQTYLDPDSRLLVLCSHPYNPASYMGDNGLPVL